MQGECDSLRLHLLRVPPLGLLHHCSCCTAAGCRGAGRDVAADERSAACHSLMAAPVDDTLLLAYPDMYDITQADAAWGAEQGGQVRAKGTLLLLSSAAPRVTLC
jgi:hypothetical protein